MKILRTHRDEDGSEDEQDQFDRALVKKHLTQLIEHFTSVRITITRHNSQDDMTRSFSLGVGDWYSQYGAAKDWLISQDERMKKAVSDT